MLNVYFVLLVGLIILLGCVIGFLIYCIVKFFSTIDSLSQDLDGLSKGLKEANKHTINAKEAVDTLADESRHHLTSLQDTIVKFGDKQEEDSIVLDNVDKHLSIIANKK
jgi:uncharacterized phage infection (PIP) family protein YhgE